MRLPPGALPGPATRATSRLSPEQATLPEQRAAAPHRILHCREQGGAVGIHCVDKVSEGNCSGKPGFNGFSLTLNAADNAEAERLFAALAEGGQIRMPMAQTFFASRFGMLADRYGLGWMVIVPA
jgi:PhnB protein